MIGRIMQLWPVYCTQGPKCLDVSLARTHCYVCTRVNLNWSYLIWMQV